MRDQLPGGWPGKPASLEIKQVVTTYMEKLGPLSPRWPKQHFAARSRLLRVIAAGLVLLLFIRLLDSQQEFATRTSPTKAQGNNDLTNQGALTILDNSAWSSHLPHIPAKVWQIYLSLDPQVENSVHEFVNTAKRFTMSWISLSPGYMYTVLDTTGAYAVINQLASQPGREYVLPLYNAINRRVMRGDFLRYLILALEGGGYGDIDTTLVQPLHEWVPEEYRNKTRLVVGIEADASPPVSGTVYEVQFCQWALAGEPGHPALWGMVDHILDKIRKRQLANPQGDRSFTDDEVLEITGPAGWTEIVYEHISNSTGESITWHNLTGMREPRLFGDTLVLPINGFATGVPHSNASRITTHDTMVRHEFHGAWRNSDN
ncbi:hypothetical protein BX600DRAFT_439358 [Xylariales sp. PMI_506]|nr:hypothetical protein BX600DRAFT_439358 [Xylariales sp. PMI_506]